MSGLLLQVNGLGMRFGGNEVLHELTFGVRDREVCGLIGPNGAGKTTLFNCMTGFLEPTSGSVWFDGRNVTGWASYRICREGMVRTWQRVRPLGKLTVLENAMVGSLLRHASVERARRMAMVQLELLGLAPYAESRAESLPIGLKKKLELARVLATEPRMLLLDEICGGLNPAETAALLESVRMLRQQQGLTVLFIEHDMKAVMSLCDRIVVLNSGMKLAEGTPAAIISNPEVIRAYLGGGGHA